MNIKDRLRKIFGRTGEKPPTLPRQVVTYDSVDEMMLGNYQDDSPRFKRMFEEAPAIAPDVSDPAPIDFATATPEEVKAWQDATLAAREARENAPPYNAWSELVSDYFYSLHHTTPPEIIDEVDAGVDVHKKIMSRVMAEDDHAKARNITRDDPVASAIGTQAGANRLRDVLENELVEQARQTEDFEEQRQRGEIAEERVERMREEARELRDSGEEVPQELIDNLKDAIRDKRSAQQAAAEIAENPIPFSSAAQEALASVATATRTGAEEAANIPSFGQGFGQGEPVYESPEQALSIAELWSNNELLRSVAELYGRMDPDMRFTRARRVVGGQDEIVDLKLGDDMRRLAQSELTYLADPELEDDFYARYTSGELLVYETVGEEHSGRGPIIIAGDESGTMSGQRNIWLKAIALCLLNIARREKRDFAYVGWSGGRQVETFVFRAKDALDPQMIVDMASHYYGGGTVPTNGVTAAVEIMDSVEEFRKADLVLVSDGEAAFGDEDRRMRDHLGEKGVRLWGIGIPEVYGYLEEFCADGAVHIHDFDLENPSEATAHLATHIS